MFSFDIRLDILEKLWCRNLKGEIGITTQHQESQKCHFVYWWWHGSCNSHRCQNLQRFNFSIKFSDSIAESIYNVKYGSSIITLESLSENLSNENKHSVFPVNFGILIHVLSWRQQKNKCLLWLLRFSDELFDGL